MRMGAAYLLLASLGLVGWAQAEPVLVEGEEFGQGVLRARSGECYAVVPEHVVGYGIGLGVMSPDRVRAPAERVTSLGDDIAVIRVQAGGRMTCGSGWYAGDDLGPRLHAAVAEGRQGTVLRVRETGGLGALAVRFTAMDDRFLEAAPLAADDEGFKGISGSRLLLEGAPVGMVLAVEDGVVLAYRQDALTHRLSRFFDAGVSSQLVPADLPVEPRNGVVLATARTAIREEPSAWSPVVRWLSVGQSVELVGKVRGSPWWQTREGFVRVGDTTTR